MLTTDEGLALAKSFVAEVTEHVPLSAAFLVGSYARGDQRETSDVDVLLIAEQFVTATFVDIKLFMSVLILPKYLLIRPTTLNATAYAQGRYLGMEELERIGIPLL